MSELDLVIRGATIYDGTGGPPRQGEIGIKGDRIAGIGEHLSGARVLDAGGLAAAPGFIDTHSHSDLRVLEQPTLDAKLRQGITLELFGQDGISVAPVKEEQVDNRRRQLAGLLTNPKGFWGWRSVAEYLAEVANAEPALDVAYLVPHGAVREWVMGLDDRLATDAELRQMQAVLRLCLQEGAYGLSTGLIYPPCCYCDSRELVALGEVAAAKRSPIVVHMRSESDRLLEAMDEMFEVGARSGVHIHLSHFKIAGKNNWAKLPQVIDRAAAAALRGVKVTADQYPYVAGSTMMGAILPPWVHAGGPEAALERLASKEARERIRAELVDPSEVAWDNFWKWSGPEGIIIADIPSGKRPHLIGLNLKQAADQALQEPVEHALDLLLEERLGVAMVSFSQSEEVVEALMKLPYVNACTDALLGGRPHPRAFGTYPRILGRYVRERQVLPLEVAVRKLSGLAADAFRFDDHGYLLA
ncbi:MAG TPA: D-aminoacylase, partial [Myxococcales bacterium]|nr:D-aminoacylase [Myxococcales bacterium]